MYNFYTDSYIYLQVFCLIESSSIRNHMASDLHDVLCEMTPRQQENKL